LAETADIIALAFDGQERVVPNGLGTYPAAVHFELA